MKNLKSLLALFSLVVCVLLFTACDDLDNKTIQFLNHEELTLLLGVEGQDSAKLELYGEEQNYTLDYDSQIIQINNNIIQAVGLGSGYITLESKNNKDLLKVNVKAGEFCGNVSIYPQYTFYLGQNPQKINIQGLNNKYQYDVEYVYNTKVFSINNLGLVVPNVCGSAELKIVLTSGINNNQLCTTTLSTTIIVATPPKLTLSLLDQNKQQVTNVNNNYTVYLNKDDKNLFNTAFYFALSGAEEITNAYILNTDLPITLAETESVNGVLYQKFFVDNKCSFALTYAYTLPNFAQEEKVSINVYVYMPIKDIQVVVDDIITNSQTILNSQTLNIYLVKDNSQQNKVLASTDYLLTDVMLSFKADDNTDQLFSVEYTDDKNSVLKTDNKYLISPTQPTTIHFVLKAIGTSFVKEFNIVVQKVLPSTILFNEIESEIYINDVIPIKPSITPKYACADISYIVQNSNILKVDNGNIVALNVGECKLEVKVNDKTKTYNFKVLSDDIHIVTQVVLVEDGLDVSYYVGQNNNHLIYNQEIQVLLFDENMQVLKPNNNIEVFVGNNIVSVRTSLNVVYVQLKSCIYNVLSDVMQYNSANL